MPQHILTATFPPPPIALIYAIELLLRLLLMGNFKGHRQTLPVAARKAMSTTPHNFEQAMRELDISVTLQEDEPETLHFQTLKDFHPDNITEQHSTLRLYKLLRKRLTRLKNPVSYAKDPNLIVSVDSAKLVFQVSEEFKTNIRTDNENAPGKAVGITNYAVHGQVTIRRRPDRTYGVYDGKYDFESHNNKEPQKCNEEYRRQTNAYGRWRSLHY